MVSLMGTSSRLGSESVKGERGRRLSQMSHARSDSFASDPFPSGLRRLERSVAVHKQALDYVWIGLKNSH